MAKDEEAKLDSPQREIVKYLEERGWEILVAGTHGIRQSPTFKMNYEYVFRFTGIKKEAKD